MVDGDTIVIDGLHIRLAGIDAPELDHPFGQQSKWALVKLCKGQVVTARLKPEMSYDRTVAECYLPDGRDLAAEMVKLGLAIDWPKFSGGRYRHLEAPDLRKKLWRAHIRQGGVALRDMPPRPVPPSRPTQWPAPHQTSSAPEAAPRPTPRPLWELRWVLLAAAMLFVIVVAGLMGNAGQRSESTPVHAGGVAETRFVVTATALNVRNAPEVGAAVVGRLEAGAVVMPKRSAGRWHGITLDDGTPGWVHGDYLRRTDR